MVKVKLTSALRRFFPDLHTMQTNPNSLIEILHALDDSFPGISDYILDDQRQLRKHVNIFIDGCIIEDRENLEMKIQDNSEVYIIQALSGG